MQQTEMKLILAGMWPPFKPLPVFKYGTHEYRAEIHFDRARERRGVDKVQPEFHEVNLILGKNRFVDIQE